MRIRLIGAIAGPLVLISGAVALSRATAPPPVSPDGPLTVPRDDVPPEVVAAQRAAYRLPHLVENPPPHALGGGAMTGMAALVAGREVTITGSASYWDRTPHRRFWSVRIDEYPGGRTIRRRHDLERIAGPNPGPDGIDRGVLTFRDTITLPPGQYAVWLRLYAVEPPGRIEADADPVTRKGAHVGELSDMRVVTVE
jgi:hypothetical protein